MQVDILHSTEDSSVNFVFKGDFPGYQEARYVRRSSEYFIVYLSSQTGCVQACRQCHLTATGQTQLIDVSVEDIIRQAQHVLDWYKTQPPAKIVHFSFMARGEPLASLEIQTRGTQLFEWLSRIAMQNGLFPRLMLSTIMPNDVAEKPLATMFPMIHPNIYYSIYSMNPDFRKHWMPKAMPAEQALLMLKDYQDMTNKIVRLHWPFIKGQNDSKDDVQQIIDSVNQLKLRVDINIVRYNPYSSKHGEEADYDVIERNAALLEAGFPQSKIKVVSRVGFDVRASCGMFVK